MSSSSSSAKEEGEGMVVGDARVLVSRAVASQVLSRVRSVLILVFEWHTHEMDEEDVDFRVELSLSLDVDEARRRSQLFSIPPGFP